MGKTMTEHSLASHVRDVLVKQGESDELEYNESVETSMNKLGISRQDILRWIRTSALRNISIQRNQVKCSIRAQHAHWQITIRFRGELDQHDVLFSVQEIDFRLQ